jgi:nitrite reductase/ring-hydroxylating ferredoxin subunit
MALQDVGGEADQAPGTIRRLVLPDGGAVALLRTDRGWTALEDRCPHAGAPLSAGALRDGYIVCAWHGWKFSCEDGTCPLFPGAPSATRRAVAVADGRVLVDDGRS